MKYATMGAAATVTATPNRWHALVTIWALQAGKHVYVEKPASHNVFEGRMMIKAAEKYGKIVQVGFQSRSDVGLREFFPWLQEGNLGKIEMLYGQCLRNCCSIGPRRDEPRAAPDGVDCNLWLGPADDVPIFRPKFHYDWHWVWNTGNGDMGNQGPHELDLLQWARGDGALPKRVMCFGNRFGWNDAGETPNVELARFDYGDYPCYFEVRNLCINPESRSVSANHGMRVGLYVKGEKGTFRGGKGGGKVYDNDGIMIRRFKGDGGGGHAKNFIKAVRESKPELIHSKIRTEKQQVQIGISGSKKRDMTGSVYVPGKGYPVEAEGVKDLLKLDDWNTIKVKAVGNVCTIWLNGSRVLIYRARQAVEEGPVGLQLHPGRVMAIDFRNIRIAELE